MAAAQEGTAKVLARQAAAAKAAGGTTAPAPAPATTPAPATARRTKPAAAPAAPAAPVAAEPAPSGTGPELAVKGLDQPRPPENLTYSAPSLDASAADGGRAKAAKTATVSGTKETPRNAPCPCGSGKKYKQCHGGAGAN
nr:SEC-C metal-binding domain-containing protein [Blastococcus saxobsidens]